MALPVRTRKSWTRSAARGSSTAITSEPPICTRGSARYRAAISALSASSANGSTWKSRTLTNGMPSLVARAMCTCRVVTTPISSRISPMLRRRFAACAFTASDNWSAVMRDASNNSSPSFAAGRSSCDRSARSSSSGGNGPALDEMLAQLLLPQFGLFAERGRKSPVAYLPLAHKGFAQQRDRSARCPAAALGRSNARTGRVRSPADIETGRSSL